MTLELVTIPCRSDNYAFLLHNAETGETALVDAPETAPIAAELQKRGWTLTDLLITHHHTDHVDGVEDLRSAYGCRVIGGARDVHRLPALNLALNDGESFTVCGETAHVFDVDGHTVGHIAFHLPKSEMLFTGDSLMALGCGRLFEGTPAQMWEAMQRLRALPASTLVCSGHEYTSANGAFALTVDPDNAALAQRVADTQAARANGQATVPSLLSLELATNPYLRCDETALKASLGMESASSLDIFTEVRTRKDNF